MQNGLDPSFNDRKYTLGGSSECWAGWIKPIEESTFKNKFSNIPTPKISDDLDIILGTIVFRALG